MAGGWRRRQPDGPAVAAAPARRVHSGRHVGGLGPRLNGQGWHGRRQVRSATPGTPAIRQRQWQRHLRHPRPGHGPAAGPAERVGRCRVRVPPRGRERVVLRRRHGTFGRIGSGTAGDGKVFADAVLAAAETPGQVAGPRHGTVPRAAASAVRRRSARPRRPRHLPARQPPPDGRATARPPVRERGARHQSEKGSAFHLCSRAQALGSASSRAIQPSRPGLAAG